jgi:hypothetical protein
MSTALPRLITAHQLAQVLGESLVTVRRHTRRGEYDAFAINVGTDRTPRWRYDTARLNRWLDARRAA